MSRGKVLPNRLLRQNQENKPPGYVLSRMVGALSLKKSGWLDSPSRPGVATPVNFSAGNNGGDEGGNNDARRASSTAGSTSDNMVRSTGTDNSSYTDRKSTRLNSSH